MLYTGTRTALCGLLICLLLATGASAIVVQPNTNAAALTAALVGSNPGLTIRSSSLQYCSVGTIVSCGTFTNESGTYGIGAGVVLSTGDVSCDGDGPNGDLSFAYSIVPEPATNGLLASITGLPYHLDCTRLDIVFDLEPGYDSIGIDAVFASEEYPRYQFTGYNDGLGIYVNGENIAIVNGRCVNINNPEVVYVDGTGFNGVLAPDGIPLLRFYKYLGDGAQSNTLTIVIGDASDAILDTGAYLSNLRAQPVPEPACAAALGVGLAELTRSAVARRRYGARSKCNASQSAATSQPAPYRPRT